MSSKPFRGACSGPKLKSHSRKIVSYAVLKFRSARSTPACVHQVTAKEIRHLQSPTKPLPMEILEIDVCSGLVVGMNGYVRKKRKETGGNIRPLYLLEHIDRPATRGSTLGIKTRQVVVSASRLVVLNVFAHKMRPSRFYERPLKYRWSMLMTIPGLLYAWPAEPRRFYGACRCRKKPQRFLARARRTTMLAQSGERKGRSDTSTWEACPICIRRRFPRLV